MNFSEKLTTLRKQKGLSQEALAEKLGVSRQAVSKWERNEAQPELSKIVALCELFEVDPNELLGYEHHETDANHKMEHNTQRAVFWLVIGCMGFIVTVFCLGWSMAHPVIYNGIKGLHGSLLGNDCMEAFLIGCAAMIVGLMESYYELNGKGSFCGKVKNWFLDTILKVHEFETGEDETGEE